MKIADLQRKIAEQKEELKELAFVKDKDGEPTNKLKIKGRGKRPLFKTVLVSRKDKSAKAETFYVYENKLYDGGGNFIKDITPEQVKKMEAADDKETFVCDVAGCGKEFKSNQALGAHKRAAHRPKK